MFGSEEEEHGVQQPRVEPGPEHGGDLGGFNLEELLNTDDWKRLPADAPSGRGAGAAAAMRRAGAGWRDRHLRGSTLCVLIRVLLVPPNDECFSLIVNVHT
jgi:hypothetical protein